MSLELSRSIVSRRVTELENRLGVRLLNRTTRRLSLTESGRLLFRHCEEIASAVDEAELAVKETETQPHGKLKVSAPIFLGQQLTRLLVGDFMDEYPELRLDLELNDDYVDIVAGGYDAVVRVGVLKKSSLVAHQIASTRLVVCASPAYFERYGLPRQPRDLVQHECIVLTAANRVTHVWEFEGRKGTITVKVPTRLETNDDDVILRALRLGRGIAYVPTLMVHDDVRAGRLQLTLEGYCRQKRGIYLLHPHGRHLPLKVTAFVDFVTERIGDLDLAP